jgi:inhibitor of KinA sporulation pathway (predicted exonuclease)
MNYIVLDLEWNQCPSGKEFEIKQLPFEIIEIGAVRLDEDMNETGTFHKLINPKVYRELHFMTRQIVNVTMEDLRKGESFEAAMKAFMSWCGEEYIFCTWGSMDLIELQRNIKYFGLEALSDKPFKFYDIQKFFSLLYEDGKLRRTLHYAADYLGMDEKLEFHSALNDAVYTAQIIKRIDFESIKKNYSIDCYNIPRTAKEEIHAVFDTYEKYISRGFNTKEELLSDKEVRSIECYICHKKCRSKVRWFTNNTRTYHALAICKEHGLLKSKIRVKQAENDLHYAVKTTKLVDEAGAQKVYDKKKALRQKRRRRRS